MGRNETNEMNETNYQYTDGGRTADGFTKERKDCTVRAIAVACEVPYSEAHDELARRGRKDSKGCQFVKMVDSDPVFCGKRLVPVYDQKNHNGKCICLVTAIKRFPTGRYIIRKAHHVFALIDGVVHDAGCESKWIMVKQMWRVEPIPQEQPKDLRTVRLQAEANDLKGRLANNGYLPGEAFNPETMPDDCKAWQARLWYIGRALVDRSIPEVP